MSGCSCVLIKLYFPKQVWSDLACWLFADGVPPGVEGGTLGVLVFNPDIANVFCRAALPICSPLCVNQFCFLPTLGHLTFAYLGEGV